MFGETMSSSAINFVKKSVQVSVHHNCIMSNCMYSHENNSN